MKDIKQDPAVSEFVDKGKLTEWETEDRMLEAIEEQCLSILFILKSRYSSTGEYSVIRQNLSSAAEKVNAIRRKLITGDEPPELKPDTETK